jgi:hypothetical protein
MIERMPNAGHPGILSRILDKLIFVLHKLKRKDAVHFLHLPKTGGTAIKFAIEPYLMRGLYVILTHPHEFKLRDVPTGERVCFVLRDPVARFGWRFNPSVNVVLA